MRCIKVFGTYCQSKRETKNSNFSKQNTTASQVDELRQHLAFNVPCLSLFEPWEPS